MTPYSCYLSRKVEVCCTSPECEQGTKKHIPTIRSGCVSHDVEGEVEPRQRELKVVAQSGVQSAFAPQAVQQAAQRKEDQPAGRALRPRPIPVSEVLTTDLPVDPTSARVRLGLQWSRRGTKPVEAERSNHHYREVKVRRPRDVERCV